MYVLSGVREFGTYVFAQELWILTKTDSSRKKWFEERDRGHEPTRKRSKLPKTKQARYTHGQLLTQKRAAKKATVYAKKKRKQKKADAKALALFNKRRVKWAQRDRGHNVEL